MTYLGTKGVSGRGWELECCATSGGTFTLVGELTDGIDDPGTWTMAPATNFQSAATEFVAAIVESPKLSFKGTRVSTDAGQVLLVAAMASGALTFFKEILPLGIGQTTTPDTYAFAGFVTNYKENLSPTKEIDWSFDVQVSNGVTRTAGS